MSEPRMLCPCCAVETVLESVARHGARIELIAGRPVIIGAVPEATVRLASHVEPELIALLEAGDATEGHQP